jgi:signal transduction histidine kinase
MGIEMDLLEHPKIGSAGEHAVSGIAKMARSLSHALNGTISVARGNLLLLKTRLHDPESQTLLQEAMNALAQQESLARSFSDISYWESYRSRRVGVRDFFEQRRDRFAQFVAEFVLDIADDACAVNTDPEYLELAINALIKNAREATTNLKQAQITVSVTTPAANTVAIAVSDNGRGIAAQNAGSIFDAGFSTKNGGHGGAGLWFVRAFAAAAGGAVSAGVNAAGGPGTSMRLTLPALEQKAP